MATVTTDLLTACPHDISDLLPTKLIPAVLSASKSSNAETRAEAVALLAAMSRRCADEPARAQIVTEILSLPKTGKTSSAEHRTCLFSMVAVIIPCNAASVIVLDTMTPLIGKEGNEAAIQALALAIIPHLTHLLQSSTPVSPSTCSTLSKELGSTKVSTRRLLSHAIGEAVWRVEVSQTSSAGKKLLAALGPAFEINLVAGANNTPANPAGYMEGYVAAALAFGALQHESRLSGSPALQTIFAITPKPSFLLNDRVYTKLPAALDGTWLLRCLQIMVSGHGEKLGGSSVR